MLLVFISSEKVTEIGFTPPIQPGPHGYLRLILTAESVGSVEEIVGGVASIINVLIFNVLLAFAAESVTVIVQFE